MWTVKISKDANSFLGQQGGKQLRLLESGIDEICQDPFSGKPLLGELNGYWSYRVGKYRIIYLIVKSEIIVNILQIQHRKEVYERLRSL